MKRLSVITALVCCIVMLCTCGCTDNDSKPKDKISVITTIFAPYDFVRSVAGDRADIKMLLKPGMDAHSYEPSPKDITDISECDLFIYTGGENDEWVEALLENSDVNTLKMIDCVDTLEEETKEGMSGHKHDHDHEHEHYEEPSEADDHVWASPANAIKIVEKITYCLCVEDKKNEEYYRKNAEDYIFRLAELDGEFTEITENAKRDTLVFGDRFPARYFTEEYGLDYFAAFPGCSSSVEANPKTLKFLINKIKDENIPAIFYIELSDRRMAKVLAEETGAKLLLFHSAHNVSADDFESGITYIDIMKNNEKALKEALE